GQMVFGALCDIQEKRSAALAGILSNVRAQNKWAMLAKWCGEIFPVYDDKSWPNEVAVWIERATSFNFGIRAHGVHINSITWSTSDELLVWVAKRPMSKSTRPGYLDQMAAGGIGNGFGILEPAIKECEEEARVSCDTTMRARSAGTTGYFMQSELGLHPEPFCYSRKCLAVPCRSEFCPQACK
ncbi:hypothetical protein BX070DRAFT_196345, partial [Coemansia spiralis]